MIDDEGPDDDDDAIDAFDSVDRLERQVERGSFFTHTLVSSFADRLNELEPILYGLVDALVARGVVDRDALLVACAATRDELAQHEQQINPGLAIRVDDAGGEPVVVDCARRMPICRSVCCKLSFALTVDEIESGKVRWDLGQPYFIRHEADGHCSHRHAATGGCTIYEHRPGVCKHFSCANDARIWKDFERMELNQEWLDANLGEERPHLVTALMHPPEDLLRKIRGRTDRDE